MKRKLSLIVLVVFVAVACFGVLAACKGGLDDFALTTFVRDLEGQFSKAQGNTSYTLDSVLRMTDVDESEITCAVDWKADNELIVFTKSDTTVSVTVPAGIDAYILTGTLVDGNGKAYDFDGNPVSRAISVSGGNQGGNSGNQGGNQGGNSGNQGGTTTGTPLEQLKANAVSSLAAGTNYKLAMWQGNSQKILYATATMSGNFLSSTENAADAATITAETATGGFYLALSSGSTKSYIKLTDATTEAKTPKAKIELVSSSADASVFTIGDHSAPITPVNNALNNNASNNFYLGTFGTHTTFSATSTYYFTDKDGNVVVDSSQWVGRLIPAGTTISGGNQGGTTTPGGNQGGSTTTTPDGTQVTIDLTGKGGSGQDGGVAFTTITQGDVTIAVDKGTNSLSPTYYTESLRLYGSNTLTITAATGKTIKSITFTYAKNDKTNAITVDVGTFATDTWTGSANSIVFSIASGSGHRRIATITIIYE